MSSIEAGTKVLASDHRLYLAAEAGDEAVVNELLYTIEESVYEGEHGTPLHAAAYRGHMTCVNLLTSIGINTRACIAFDRGRPLHAALQGMSDRGEDRTECIVTFIKANVNPLLTDDKGRNTLRRATQLRLTVAQDLLEFSAQEDRETTVPSFLNEALLVYAEEGNEAGMKDALTEGAQLKYTNKANRSALHYAAMHGFTRLLPLLLKGKIIINALDDDGMTPLHLAAYYGHEAFVSALVADRRVNVRLKAPVKDIAIIQKNRPPKEGSKTTGKKKGKKKK